MLEGDYLEGMIPVAEEVEKDITPEQELWGAVLLDAAKLVAAYHTGKRPCRNNNIKHVRDAVKWWNELHPMFTQDVGGFEWVCEKLGYCPDLLRGLQYSPDWQAHVLQTKRLVVTSIFRAGPLRDRA